MTQINADDAKSFLDMLRETRRFLSQSADSIWANSTVSEILTLIDEQITHLVNAQTCQLAEFKLLFAPTGALQETAIDNDWGERFLQLSAECDRIVNQK